MQTRREILKSSGIVAATLLGSGLLPGVARAYQKNAFEAKSMEDVFKALGLPMPQESAEVMLIAPDIGGEKPLAIDCPVHGPPGSRDPIPDAGQNG